MIYGASRGKDRGLLAKRDSTGELMWYVRLYDNGKERRFGAFKNKTEARDFYEKAKQEQKQGRFFPERYQHGGHVLIEELLTRQAATTTVKNKAAEQHHMAWWKARLTGVRLTHVTSAVIEDAQRVLLAQNLARKRCPITSKRSPCAQQIRAGWAAPPQLPAGSRKVQNGKKRFSLRQEMRSTRGVGATHGPWAQASPRPIDLPQRLK